MIAWLIYCAIGIGLGLLARDDKDGYALFTAGLITVVLFALIWPAILMYVIHTALQKGFIVKYKGKEIWKYKR